jgi:hypothetical protein
MTELNSSYHERCGERSEEEKKISTISRGVSHIIIILKNNLKSLNGYIRI